MKKMILLFTLTLVSANTVKGMDGTYAAKKYHPDYTTK